MAVKYEGETNTFRYITDVTILNKLMEPGQTYYDVFRNLTCILEAKTSDYCNLTKITAINKRKLKTKTLKIPITLHKDAVGIWGWLRKTGGAGAVLNIAMSEALLDMKRKGIASFNQYCDEVIRREY